jgi:hypothetical protein
MGLHASAPGLRCFPANPPLGVTYARRSSVKRTAPAPPSLVIEDVARAIIVIRERRVLLDEDLASLYDVATKALLQAVRRNRDRFPDDFLLELTDAEWAALRSQTVTLDSGRGKHRKYRPFAFTEQGVAMLSSVLRSQRAIAVNVQIMRAFVRMRELLSANQELATRLNELEARLDKKLAVHDEAIAALLSAIRELLNPPAPKSRGIGRQPAQGRPWDRVRRGTRTDARGAASGRRAASDWSKPCNLRRGSQNVLPAAARSVDDPRGPAVRYALRGRARCRRS